MEASQENKYQVAVIGAGPAGLFASRMLALNGVHVTLINRDIRAGGLAEYGIYPDKLKMKEGLRKQFDQILQMAEIEYLGHITIGTKTGLSLRDLQAMGFQAVLVTVGAQGTKWLGLPGEDLQGVFHAKDLVYHYNSLPPFSTEEYPIGRRVALVGVGNVMMDIAHWLVREKKVDEVVAVARRGPAEVKFSKKEMEIIARNLDMKKLDEEIERVAPIMKALDQDVRASKDFILSAMPKALEPVSDTRFYFDFLVSPTRILGDASGRVCALEVEENTLVRRNGDTKARGLGTFRTLDVDTVIFAIGDRVDSDFGLPVQGSEFVKNLQPAYPVNDLSYEVFDPGAGKPIEGVFVAGWAREASSGLVGVARKDGENGAHAILQYLQTKKPAVNLKLLAAALDSALEKLEKPVVHYSDLKILEAIESEEAARQGLEEFKLKTDEEMLAAMGLDKQQTRVEAAV